MPARQSTPAALTKRGKDRMADDEDMIGDATPDVEVEEEEVAAEVPTSFATKGLGWSGRDEREM